MKTKNLWVSFAVLAIVLSVLTNVAASEVTSDYSVYVRGTIVEAGDVVSVEEGETIPIKIVFASDINTSDIKVKAEIDGYDVDVEDETSKFDVEDGKRYSKSLTLKIPYDLDEDLSEDATLEIEVYNKDYKTELSTVELRVQRESYNVDVMSIDTPQTVEGGQMLPVDIVLKNVGYNDLDDVYVVASVPALGLQRRAYFGDIVALECDDDDSAIENYGVDIDRRCNEDDKEVTYGRIYLQVPEDAEAGLYAVEVKVSNEDTTETATSQVSIESKFSGDTVVSTVTGRTVGVNEDAEYSILIVNPTSKLAVYRIAPEASDVTVGVSESITAIPAGSSRTVKLMASSDTEGTYNFNVNVFSGDELVDTETMSLNVVEGSSTTTTVGNPVVVLTIVLAIIFIVLLIVLFVLIGKKPEKSEEFGESYY